MIRIFRVSQTAWGVSLGAGVEGRNALNDKGKGSCLTDGEFRITDSKYPVV